MYLDHIYSQLISGECDIKKFVISKNFFQSFYHVFLNIKEKYMNELMKKYIVSMKEYQNLLSEFIIKNENEINLERAKL